MKKFSLERVADCGELQALISADMLGQTTYRAR